MKWFNKDKPQLVVSWSNDSLPEAVDQALADWQHAQRLVDLSEGVGEIDDSIYYLQMTEKRYVFLLNQAKLQTSGA